MQRGARKGNQVVERCQEQLLLAIANSTLRLIVSYRYRRRSRIQTSRKPQASITKAFQILSIRASAQCSIVFPSAEDFSH